MNLKHLTDNALLKETRDLVKAETRITLQILHRLREIERRRVFSDLGYGSLFEFAVKELGYAEASANRRIQSARLLEEMPEIEKKIEQGKLTLTNVALAAQTIKNEKLSGVEVKKQIFSRIEGLSKRECEKTLMSFTEPSPLPPERVRVITSEFYAVNFNFSEKTMELWEEVRDLLSHKRKSQDEMIQIVLSKAIQQLRVEKYKLNALPRTPVAKPCTKRSIPHHIKKLVYLRDGGKCVKCGSKYKVEFDHIVPFSHGGSHTEQNLRLLCFSCNQRRLKA